MKKKILTLVLAALIASTLLSACSGRNSGASAASGADSSAAAEPESDEDDAETSDVDEPFQEEDVEVVDEPKTVRIDADGGLRLRSGPGTEYDIIRLIPDNAYADVAEGEKDDPGWLYVSYDGDFGWVSKDYILYEQAAAVDSSTAWAKVYYDYLSTFESVTYTSTMYGSTHTVAGRVIGGEKIASSGIEFRNFDGYDYPVLICWDGEAVDADGNMDGAMFNPNVYLVENEKITVIDKSNSKWQTFVLTDGYPSPKGSMVMEFSFKPENNGGPENVKKALEWLKSQM